MPKGKADITNTKQGDKAMTNIFEETYNTMRAAQRAFKAAATDEGRNAAEAAYKEAEDRITKEGDTAWKLWRAYEISRRERDPELRRHHLEPGGRAPHRLHERERNRGLHLLLQSNGRGRNLMAFQRGRLQDRRDGRGQPQKGPLGQWIREGSRFQDEPQLKTERTPSGREP
jgi:hypothetical protein